MLYGYFQRKAARSSRKGRHAIMNQKTRNLCGLRLWRSPVTSSGFCARIMDGRGGIQGYSGFSILLRISPLLPSRMPALSPFSSRKRRVPACSDPEQFDYLGFDKPVKLPLVKVCNPKPFLYIRLPYSVLWRFIHLYGLHEPHLYEVRYHAVQFLNGS